MKYEEERIGNPFSLLNILIVKKFQVKLQVNRSEWKDIKLFFTVDSNMLAYDEK